MSEPPVILIVDDVPTNLSLLTDCLRPQGYRLLTAENGETAIQRIRLVTPDLVLLDIMMPRLDGFQTARLMRKEPGMAEVPILFLTALNDSESLVKGFQAGASDYVTKPIQPAEIIARVNTHLKTSRLQASLRQEIASKDTLIEELNAFGYTVAHDLKNPLNGILGSSDYLCEHWQEFAKPEVDDCLKMIRDLSHRMGAIIDELMLLNSVRQEPIEIGPFEMKPVFESACTRINHLFHQFEAELDYPNEWPAALGHGPWIEEVWSNYLSNAMQYGGRPPRLWAGFDFPTPEIIRYWVRDNGEGMTAEQQGKLFHPFTRLDRIRFKGHGLGLSIVHRILTKLGGRPGVESQPGQGSTFYFILPAPPASTAAP